MFSTFSSEERMVEDVRKSYPMMPIPHWWALRRKFRAAIPREVSNNYLASALGMTEASARTNIMPTLRGTGIIDTDNKPTELAVRWRDDAQYQAVCANILDAVYPQELRDLAPDASVGRPVVQTWFANHTGLGESGAQKMASFYLMLLDADVAKQTEAQAIPRSATKQHTRPARQASPSKTPNPPVEQQPTSTGGDKSSSIHLPKRPELNINVQIHISADASSDQIEQIFSSMAKHLKDFS